MSGAGPTAKGGHQRGAGHRFSDAGVGAGNEKASQRAGYE